MNEQNGLDMMLKTGRYSGHAIAMPTTTAAIEMTRRLRSSVRCSMTVMVPSGFCRRRLRVTAIGSPFRTRRETATASANWDGITTGHSGTERGGTEEGRAVTAGV